MILTNVVCDRCGFCTSSAFDFETETWQDMTDACKSWGFELEGGPAQRDMKVVRCPECKDKTDDQCYPKQPSIQNDGELLTLVCSMFGVPDEASFDEWDKKPKLKHQRYHVVEYERGSIILCQGRTDAQFRIIVNVITPGKPDA